MASKTPNATPSSRRATRRQSTKRLAVCAVLTALGVTLSWLGSLVGILDLCTPFITALLLIPIVVEYGRAYPWGIWLATTVLSLLLLPSKAPAAVYLVFGYYPILKAYLERLPRLICMICKQALYVAVDIALILGSSVLFGVEEHLPDWYPLALGIGGFLVLNLVDVALTRLVSVYVFKYRGRVAKWMN